MRINNVVSRSIAVLRNGDTHRHDTATASTVPSIRMLLNSMALMASTASTLILGFLTWIIAARIFPASQVGLASGAVSAMMLCVQIALLGTGPAIVVLLPLYRRQSQHLLNTAVHVATLAAIIAAAGFLILASSIFRELGVVAATPTYVVLFIIMSIAGTLGLLFDQASIAQHRSDQVLMRGISSGAVRLVLISAFPVAIGSTNSQVIFLGWVIGSVIAVFLALVHLSRSPITYRYRPIIDAVLGRELLRVGLPNHALTLADRAPGLIMPIVATEILSPAAGAYWYTVWMMAWVVFVIPSSVGNTLFAEAANRPDALEHGIRQSLRTSLLLGAVAALVVGMLAYPLLSVLGERYAASGTMPLRILVLSVFPLTFIQLYFAVSRTTGRLRQAVLSGMVTGIIAVGAAAGMGSLSGLTGMAIAWLFAQTLTALWGGYWLQRLIRQHRVEHSSQNDVMLTQ